LNLGWDNSVSGGVAEEPEANASTKDQGDDIGDDDCVDKLVFTLGRLEHSEAFGAALGGAGLDRFPLLGREDVGSGAPVPDEVRDLSILDVVDVDMAEVCGIWVVLSAIAGAVGWRLGGVGSMGHEGGHSGGCPG
jgi:hypothetical protein